VELDDLFLVEEGRASTAHPEVKLSWKILVLDIIEN
jgi:hypothetical protein